MIDIDKLSYNEKIELAKTSNDINILDILAKDKSFDIRYYVAINRNTPAETLSILAKDIDWVVRHHVAYNGNTPVEALIILAKDKDWGTRYYVASHTNTSVEILKKLINDEHKYVKKQALTRLAELKGLTSFI